MGELNRSAQIGLALCGTGLTYIGLTAAYRQYRIHINDVRREKKQAYCKASIEAVRTHLKGEGIEEAEVETITSLSLLSLREQLKSGHLKPVQVLRAFQAKALAAHDRTNCLVEFIKEAEDWAAQLESGPVYGELWGIPISLKDDICIKGYENCIGEALRIGCSAPEDSTFVKVLRYHGAIPFVKTNVPQSLASLEPGNPINGTVRHPRDLTRGPGGSSSGEAALMASGGSILGMGSDIGGSIRVPAHFCGVLAFRPTTDRMRQEVVEGMVLNEPDFSAVIPITWGPFAKDVDSLIQMMKVLWDGLALGDNDPECVPLPFQNEVVESTRPLRVGYYIDREGFPTFSACVRAVHMAKECFLAEGHEVVPWEVPGKDTCQYLAGQLLAAPGIAKLHEQLKYDRIDPTLQKSLLNNAERPLYKTVLSTLFGLLGFSEVPTTLPPSAMSVAAFSDIVHQLHAHRRLVREKWKQAGLDLVICPPHVIVAPPFGNADLLWRNGHYPCAFSVLHSPSGVIPMTEVTEEDLMSLDTDFLDTDKWQRQAKEAMTGSVGLPVGVMISALRYNDELCLRGMKILQNGKGRKPLH